tara:strand:+ start:251 stop:691 length:441 start_codon:yes stop_codon:yes gene_type:complete
MAKYQQIMCIKSKWGGITNVFTVVNNLVEYVDETFPGYFNLHDSLSSDGSRVVYYKDGTSKKAGHDPIIFDQKIKDDPNAIGYSNKGSQIERSVMLDNDGYIKFERKYNNEECYAACNSKANWTALVQLIDNHPNFEIVTSSEVKL